MKYQYLNFGIIFLIIVRDSRVLYSISQLLKHLCIHLCILFSTFGDLYNVLLKRALTFSMLYHISMQDEPPPPETLGRSTRIQPHRLGSPESLSQPESLPEELIQQGELTSSRNGLDRPNCYRHFVARTNHSQMAQVRLR